jgi:hypothetical protein
MSRRRLSASAVRRVVGIGQRWTRRRDGIVVVVYQVHRGEGTVEVSCEGADPRVPHTRWLVGFVELSSKYRQLEHADAEKAA